MTYEEALEKLTKPKENMVLITLDYSTGLLLPFDDGVTYVKTFKNAEVLKSSYDNTATTIQPFDDELRKVSPFSYKKYQDIKVAQLMGISYKELLESKK